MIRSGKISSINYAKGTARVLFEDEDGAVTREIPFMNSSVHDTYAVGDSVITAFLDNGNAGGVIMGRQFTKNKPPAESGAGLYRHDFGDGSYFRVSGKKTELNSGDIKAVASGELLFDAPESDVPINCSKGATSIADMLTRLERLEGFHL